MAFHSRVIIWDSSRRAFLNSFALDAARPIR